MSNIYIFENGAKKRIHIERMFKTHGPYLLEGRRLDQLAKVQLIHDSSTSTQTQRGTSIDNVNNLNMLKRAAVGGILTGGVGAVIGGATAQRQATFNTTTKTHITTELTAELIYLDGTSQYVLFDDLKPFHWLLGCANQTPLSDAEIEAERLTALREQTETELRKILNPKVEQLFLPPVFAKDKAKQFGIPALAVISVILLMLMAHKFLALIIIAVLVFTGRKIATPVIERLDHITDDEIRKRWMLAKQDIVNQAIALNLSNIRSGQITFDPYARYTVLSNETLEVRPATKVEYL